MYKCFPVLLCLLLFLSSSFIFANVITLLPTVPETILIKFSGDFNVGSKGFVELEDGSFGIFVNMRIHTDESASACQPEIVRLKEGSLHAEGNKLFYENCGQSVLVGKKWFSNIGYPKWYPTGGAKIIVKCKEVSWDLIYSIYLKLP